MTEYILLGFLMERDMTGYDMKQHMSMSTSYFADASFGSIYPSLKRLEQKGLVVLKEDTRNGKLKKIYSINEQGRAAFLKWLASPIEHSKTDASAALLKIFFFGYLPHDKVNSLIEQYINGIENYRNSLLKLKRETSNKMNSFELCTLDFGLDYYEFIIRWYQNRFKNKKREAGTSDLDEKG